MTGAVPFLTGSGVVARERGSGGLILKDVAGERGVEGGLEVRARGHPGLRLDGRGEQREDEDEGGADYVFPLPIDVRWSRRQLDDTAAAGRLASSAALRGGSSARNR